MPWLAELERQAAAALERQIAAARSGAQTIPERAVPVPLLAPKRLDVPNPAPDVAVPHTAPEPVPVAVRTSDHAPKTNESAGVTPRVTKAQDWRANAACLGNPVSMFFDPDPDGKRDFSWHAAALAVCAECTVRDDCRDFAITMGERHGVWGGMTSSQRARWVQENGHLRYCIGCGQQVPSDTKGRPPRCDKCIARRREYGTG
jgi:WhiB family redox-sensing transcriptional regulator